MKTARGGLGEQERRREGVLSQQLQQQAMEKSSN
jgi:hypothetical protein